MGATNGLLRERIRLPVLLQLRRCIAGYRRTEQLAEEFCEAMAEAREEREPRLRLRVAAALDRLVAEEGGTGVSGAEFDRDWASGRLLAALREFRRVHPRTHMLFLRLFDRPEGEGPLEPAELARRLEMERDEVERALVEGRAELLRLFSAEVALTVDDPALADSEVEALLPYAGALFTGT